MKDILEVLTVAEERLILKTLCDESPEMAKKIERLANKNLSNIDIEEIAEDVFAELDFLDVEDLWDNSGAKSYGYEDPADEAHEMVKDALEPFEKRLHDFRQLGLFTEEKLYCMGVLKGINRYSKESQSEFKDWASDSPDVCFQDIIDDWKNNCKNSGYLKEMDEFASSLV